MKPGRLADGANLYLRNDKSGGKRWVCFYRLRGKQREAGLGGANYLGLAKAREIAAGMRELLAQGVDPLDARRAGRRATAAKATFGECADVFLAANESSWRNAKHRAQWRMTLETYAAPLRDVPVAEVSTQDILKILQPIWRAKAETASRLRGRRPKPRRAFAGASRPCWMLPGSLGISRNASPIRPAGRVTSRCFSRRPRSSRAAIMPRSPMPMFQPS
ncbi:MAG: tyrosine-type recombinase/integrase [Beijerinckiaceae bacterium]